MSLDIRTLVLVLGITNLIVAVAMALQYRLNRAYRGIGWWALGSAAIAAAYGIFSPLRSVAPLELISIVLQNSLTVLGLTCHYVGSMRFLERKENRTAVIAIFAIFIAPFVYFTYADNDINTRTVLICVTAGILSLMTANAFRRPTLASVAGSARFLAAVFFVSGCSYAFRAGETLAGARTMSYTSSSPTYAATFLVAIIEGTLMAFGFIVMINQRLNAELRDEKEHFERIFNTSPDGSVITRLSDGLIVNVNDGFAALSGYSRAEAIGRSSLDVNIWDDPADRRAVVDEVVARGACRNYEATFRRKDGGRIFGSMSAMVIRLHDVPHIISVTRDISGWKRTEELLRAKNTELERFTYAVSHDLKSPLVTITTFLGFLEHDIRKSDAEGIGKNLEVIRRAADKMSQLLDELLDLTRVGHTLNLFVDAPLREVVQEALDLVAGRIAERGVTVDVTGEPVMLHGDRARLVEVFQNLVDNAVKFMGEQEMPRVEIGSERAGGETVFFVRDNGIGIDPRNQSRIFDLFEKLDPGVEGTGIGLALVKRIVELHGGRIRVESEGSGSGTTFRFTMPGRRTAAQESASW
jgi:PAS domain S-box-containing protein